MQKMFVILHFPSLIVREVNHVIVHLETSYVSFIIITIIISFFGGEKKVLHTLD